MHAISKGSLYLSAFECLPLRAAELLWGAGGVELLNWKRKLSIESTMSTHHQIARYMILILLQRQLFLLQFSLVFLILRNLNQSSQVFIYSIISIWCPVACKSCIVWVGISVLELGTSATITALVTRDKDSTAGQCSTAHSHADIAAFGT